MYRARGLCLNTDESDGLNACQAYIVVAIGTYIPVRSISATNIFIFNAFHLHCFSKFVRIHSNFSSTIWVIKTVENKYNYRFVYYIWFLGNSKSPWNRDCLNCIYTTYIWWIFWNAQFWSEGVFVILWHRCVISRHNTKRQPLTYTALCKCD